jgi:hypothetical protein
VNLDHILGAVADERLDEEYEYVGLVRDVKPWPGQDLMVGHPYVCGKLTSQTSFHAYAPAATVVELPCGDRWMESPCEYLIYHAWRRKE